MSRWAKQRGLLASLLVALSLSFCTRFDSQAQSPSERILFAVWPAEAGTTPNAPLIDPIGVLAGSRVRSLGDYGTLPDSFFARFEKKHYQPGLRFPLLLGGGNTGQVVVQKAVGISCESLVATVRLPIVLRYPEMALAATSSEDLGLHESWRTAPTPEQRAAFLQLSVSFLKRKPLAAFAAADVKIDRLYSTKLGRAEPGSLIGSVTLEGKATISHLLLVATRKTPGYFIALSSYHVGHDVEDRTDDVDEHFVDQLDLDNDGVDEVITIRGYYESWDYVVYKRFGAIFKKIYEGAGGGC